MRVTRKNRLQIFLFLFLIVLIIFLWNTTTTESFFDKKEACDAVAADNAALNAVPGILAYKKLTSSATSSQAILDELTAMKNDPVNNCAAAPTSYTCTTLTSQIDILKKQLTAAKTYKDSAFFSTTVSPVIDGISKFVALCATATDAIATGPTSVYNALLNSDFTFTINTPLDIPNCVSWLDSTLYKDQKDGTEIKRWAPSSSAVGTTQYSMIGSATIKTGVLNNKPVLQFDSSRTMTMCVSQADSAGNVSCSSKRINEPGAYTMFFVSRQTGGANGRVFGGDGNKLYGYHGNMKRRVHIETWNVGEGDGKAVASDTNWDLIRMKRDSANAGSLHWNGELIKNYTTIYGITGFNINQDAWGEKSNAQVAEIIIYNRALTDPECGFVEQYLNRKWFPTASSPIDLDGCTLWLDAFTFNSLSDGSLITTWKSSAPTIYNYFMKGSAILNKTGLNGKPVLQFDGTRSMGLSATMQMNAYTLFFVSRQTGGLNRRVFIGNGNKLYGYWAGYKNCMHTEEWNISPSTPSDTNWDMYRIRRNEPALTQTGSTYTASSTTGSMWRQGGLIANFSSSQRFDGFYINEGGCCGGETSNAQVAEVIIYDRSLTDSECTTVERYLKSKWGL
jgi:hypothetical protein